MFFFVTKISIFVMNPSFLPCGNFSQEDIKFSFSDPTYLVEGKNRGILVFKYI